MASDFLKRKAAQSRQNVTRQSGEQAYGGKSYDYTSRKPSAPSDPADQSDMRLNPLSVAQSIADEHNRNENVREIGLANSITRAHDDAENVRAVRMPDALSMLRTTSNLANRVRDYQNAANISSEHDMREDVRYTIPAMRAQQITTEHDLAEDVRDPAMRRLRASGYAGDLTRGIQSGTMSQSQRRELANEMLRELTNAGSGQFVDIANREDFEDLLATKPGYFSNAFSDEEIADFLSLYEMATSGRVSNAADGIFTGIAANLSSLPTGVAQDASDWKKYREQYDGDYWQDFFTKPVSEMRNGQVEAGLAGRPIDEDSLSRQLYNVSQEQKNAATAGLSENGIGGTKYFSPKWLAEQGISVVENAPNMLLTAMNPAVGTAYMVGNAGGNRALELSEQGVNAGEAVQRGLVSGAIEALTERYSIEKFLDAFTNNKGALLNILSQMGVEASEESAAYVLNYAADLAARDPNAEFSVAELIDNAMGGAFSGGIYGGIGQVGRAVGRAASRSEQTQNQTAQQSAAPAASEQAAPAPVESTVDRALREQAERGGISNSTAEAILADSDAMAALGVRAENSMTKSQQRAAVKEAVRSRQSAQENANVGASGLDVEALGTNSRKNYDYASRRDGGRTADFDAQWKYYNEMGESGIAYDSIPERPSASPVSTAVKQAAYFAGKNDGMEKAKALVGRVTAGEHLTDAEVDLLLGHKESRRLFEQAAGVKFSGKMSENQTVVRDYMQNQEWKNAKTIHGDQYGLIESDISKQMNAEDVEFIDTLLKATASRGILSTAESSFANAEVANGFVKVYANAQDAGDAYRGTVKHEVTHRIKELGGKTYRRYERVALALAAQSHGVTEAQLIRTYQNRYATKARQNLTVSQAREEIAADFAMHFDMDEKSVQAFLNQSAENRSTAKTILETIRSALRAIKERFTTDKLTREQMKFTRELEKAERLWADALGESSQISKKIEATGQSDSDFDGIKTNDVKNSLKNDELFMEKARQKNGSTGFVSASEMDAAEKARSVIANLFRDPALQDALNLPQDVMGNTFLANSSYGGSEENTTVCIRTLAAEYLMDAVAEELGRPLTVEDTIAISQEYWKYTDKPECLYCYVAMDRKAHREFLGEYLRQRDAVVADIRNGMSRTDAYQKFLDGRKDTRQMRDRFNMWSKNAETNAEVITARDLASQRSMEQAAAKSKAMRNQVNDALKYAQSASWAKKRISYKAYNNHILRWTQKRVNDLNDHYGLRMYSFSDFSPAFILENMQMFTDAAVRGLKVLAYTKELDFVRIFAKTGANINISVFAHEQNGQISEDAMQGAPWKEAQELRSQNRNVGCTFVATNDNQVAWALDQDWIDVIIPFHLVRTGSKVAQAFGWKNYTAMSADVKDKANGWDANRDKTGIYPTEHLNDKEKYLAALEENHLKPRFAEWVDHPNYMKLVNETRQSVLQSEAVKPVFNVDAAKQSINDMIKRGGYYVPIGGSEVNMRDIAGEIAESIENKKTDQTDGKKYSLNDSSNAGSLGNQRLGSVTESSQFKRWFKNSKSATDNIGTFDRTNPDIRYSISEDSDGRKLTEEQQKYFSGTKAVDQNGRLLTLYHGTRKGGFTVFRDWTYLTESKKYARRYADKDTGETVYEVYANIQKPFDTRLEECREIWEQEFYGSYSRTDLQESGLPDWTDGYDLVDFLEENGYDYDAILLDEGADPDGMGGVVERGISYVVRSSEQIKNVSNKTPTSDRDIRRSIKATADLVEKYGRLPQGEYPSREVIFPQQTNDDTRVRRFSRTAAESNALTDEQAGALEQAVLNGVFDYEVVGDKGSIAQAENRVSLDAQQALDDWRLAIGSGNRITKDDIALGEVLLRKAAADGDTDAVVRLTAEIAEAGTRAGQVVQAMRLLKKMSGAGQLASIDVLTKQYQRMLKKRYGSKAPLITIPDSMKQRLANAKTDAEIAAAKDEIFRHIASQIPSNWEDQWNAWRYLSMLGNLRTHARNGFGNAVFMPIVCIKNTVGAVLEAGADMVSKNSRGKGIERTKTLQFASREAKDFAKADFAEMEDIVKNGGKYNDSQKIDDYRTIFTNKALEWARKANGHALEFEDGIFLGWHYRNALASYLTANHVDVSTLNDGSRKSARTLDRARAYAIREAQKATYRDASHTAEIISRASRQSYRAIRMVLEGLLPFKKTPINILKRGIEYSPAGLVRALYHGVQGVKDGKYSANEVIDDLAAGLTGTGIVAVGYLMTSLNLLSGGADDDDRSRWYKDMLGYQTYALTIGDKSYTIDWLAPGSMPLFVGAELFRMTHRAEKADDETDGEKIRIVDLLNAFEMLTAPLNNMSMLSGVNETLDHLNYSGDTDNALANLFTDSVLSYFSQAVPTLGGQIARTIDGTRRTTYVDKTNQIPDSIERSLQKARGKVPMLSKKNPAYINLWGETEETEDPLYRLVSNMVSPGYADTVKVDDLDRELLRLYNATGENVLPNSAGRSIQVDGEKINLTVDEFQTYATTLGQTSHQILYDLVDSMMYQNADDADKVMAVDLAYKYANAVAKTKVSDYQPDGWIADALEGASVGLTPDEAILYEAAVSGIRRDRKKWAEAHEDENPKTSLKEDIIAALDDMDWLSNKERSFLYLSEGYSPKNNPYK